MRQSVSFLLSLFQISEIDALTTVQFQRFSLLLASEFTISLFPALLPTQRMDSFHMDNVKAEKAKAMLRYRRLRKMANLFRCFEVFLALVLFSWFSTRLPVAFRISGQFFRELSGVLVSPRFVFLVGNAIILTLFVKSGKFFAQGFSPNTSAADYLYDEFVKNNSDNNTRQKPRSDNNLLQSPATEPEEITCDDKDTMPEEEGVIRTLSIHAYTDEHEAPSDSKIIFRRSRSENMKMKLKRDTEEKPPRELRRSETETCRKLGRDAEKAAEEMASYAEESMSNEEFQRTVDAFIAMHQKFRREEESMDIVLQNHC
ncbi:hypothetical protein NE237_016671 [Protea cynaroides]|uniref:DUF4408 domain-containing protein n=1 Tax=Protea cynaroides TaxID=273540 RepID=A0A9Q0HEA2_9MAGN|nr:hypothetical protein NE237_016671 [Protea cynaroides]